MRRLSGRAGVTLTELMISVAILSVGIIGFMGAFTYITKALHGGRSRTLSTNLAQEKIETLKNLSYYELLITTTSSQDTNFTPAIVYDSQYYPPERIVISSITYTRYTYVALAQVFNDVVSTVSYTYPDTGMKEIISTVVWNDQGTWKKFSLTNLLENPNVAPLDSTLKGTVNAQSPSGASLGGLASALVYVEQNPDYQTYTDANGNYSFSVYHGTYTVRASSTGYYDSDSGSLTVSEGNTVTASAITLTQIATGTIRGFAWVSSATLISQVVMDTNTYVYSNGTLTSQHVEYFELFNPTTSEFDLAPAGCAPSVQYGTPPTCSSYYANLNYSDKSGTLTNNFVTLFVSTYVAPNHYFLIANTSNFLVSGQWMAADAYYSGNIVQGSAQANDSKCGSLQLVSVNTGMMDQVGWGGSGACAGGTQYSIGTYVQTSAGIGAGQQLVRVSSPAAGSLAIAQWGRAYNSAGAYGVTGIGGNKYDWIYQDIAGYQATYAAGALYAPNGAPGAIWIQPYHENINDRTSAGVGLVGHTDITTAPVVAGIPAIAAYVSASDPYSGSTKTVTVYITSGTFNLPAATFTLVGVTTTVATASNCAGNCWQVDIASAVGAVGYSATIATITVTQNQVHWIPDANTVGAWAVSNQNEAIMTISTGGYVKGTITDVNANAINGVTSGVKVQIGGITKTLGTNGDYFIPSTTGTVIVVANATSQSPYIQTSAQPTVNQGQITQQNFTLLLGGTVEGYVTGGTTPLPNYTMVATLGGSESGSGVSNTSGNFFIRNITTGTYTIQPALDASQSYSFTGSGSYTDNTAISLTGTGSTIFIGTFTINGAMGVIAGTVTLSGGAVNSGALILGSSTAWTSVSQMGASPTYIPTAIVGSSAPAYTTSIYAISSLADGSYSLPVRGGASYYLLVYIPTLDLNGDLKVSTGSYSNVYVSPGATTTKNIAQ